MCVHGKNIPLKILGVSFDGSRIGDATMIWEPTLPDLPPNGDSEVFVEVTGINFNGHNGKYNNIQYSVTIFDSDRPGWS